MALDFENPLPLYYQLKTIIEGQIASGHFKPGEKITSESLLCKQYMVSRTTARQAITELVNNGKLVRTQGRGTFVASPAANRKPYRITGFSADMQEQGFSPSSKVLDFRVMIPSTEVSRIMQIASGEAVIYIRRLRYINGQIMGIESTHLPFKRFPTLTREDVENSSLYEMLVGRFEIIPTRAAMTFESVFCDEEYCQLLESTPEIPLLHITDLTYDQNDNLFEYSQTYYRGDRYSLHVDINSYKNESIVFIQKSKLVQNAK